MFNENQKTKAVDYIKPQVRDYRYFNGEGFVLGDGEGASKPGDDVIGVCLDIPDDQK